MERARMKLDFDDWTDQVTKRLNALSEVTIFLSKEVERLQKQLNELQKENNA